MAVAAGIVLVPGAALVPILFLSQALNAVLLPPLLIFMARIGRDPLVMGLHRSGRVVTAAYGASIAVVVASVGGLAVLTLK